MNKIEMTRCEISEQEAADLQAKILADMEAYAETQELLGYVDYYDYGADPEYPDNLMQKDSDRYAAVLDDAAAWVSQQLNIEAGKLEGIEPPVASLELFAEAIKSEKNVEQTVKERMEQNYFSKMFRDDSVTLVENLSSRVDEMMKDASPEMKQFLTLVKSQFLEPDDDLSICDRSVKLCKDAGLSYDTNPQNIALETRSEPEPTEKTVKLTTREVSLQEMIDLNKRVAVSLKEAENAQSQMYQEMARRDFGGRGEEDRKRISNELKDTAREWALTTLNIIAAKDGLDKLENPVSLNAIEAAFLDAKESGKTVSAVLEENVKESLTDQMDERVTALRRELEWKAFDMPNRFVGAFFDAMSEFEDDKELCKAAGIQLPDYKVKDLLPSKPIPMDIQISTPNEEYHNLSRWLCGDEKSTEKKEQDFDNSLSYLMIQQGHSLEELSQEDASSPLLDSLRNEIITVGNNEDSSVAGKHYQTTACIAMTGQMMLDYMDIMVSKEETAGIELSENTAVGFHDAVNGKSGDINIQLEQPLVIPSDMISHIVIEGSDPSDKPLEDISMWTSGRIYEAGTEVVKEVRDKYAEMLPDEANRVINHDADYDYDKE